MIEDHVAEQLAEAMETQGITKLEMAARMTTSRRRLHGLFDPRFAVPQTPWAGRFASNWCDAWAKPQASLVPRRMRGTVRSR